MPVTIEVISSRIPADADPEMIANELRRAADWLTSPHVGIGEPLRAVIRVDGYMAIINDLTTNSFQGSWSAPAREKAIS